MKQTESRPSKMKTSVKILIGLVLLSLFMATTINIFADGTLEGNVALIPIYGPIMVGSSDGLGSSSSTSSNAIVGFIKEANENPSIKAIVFDINSPGGSAVASEEIARAIINSEKPTVAWIREVGASGAYWISSSTDHTIASPVSVTGSIGVIASYLEFSEFLDDWNVTYRRLVAGEFKDMGSPLKELTPQEEVRLQKLIDDIREYFIDVVAENRGLERSHVESLATGEVFLGKDAIQLGLIDELGSQPEVITYIENELNETVEFVRYQASPSLLELLGGIIFDKEIKLSSDVSGGIRT